MGPAVAVIGPSTVVAAAAAMRPAVVGQADMGQVAACYSRDHARGNSDRASVSRSSISQVSRVLPRPLLTPLPVRVISNVALDFLAGPIP